MVQSIQNVNSNEGAAIIILDKRRNYYIQFLGGWGGLTVEAVGPKYAEHLHRVQAFDSVMRNLGWQLGESGNYALEISLASAEDAESLARRIVETAKSAYGTPVTNNTRSEYVDIESGPAGDVANPYTVSPPHDPPAGYVSAMGPGEKWQLEPHQTNSAQASGTRRGDGTLWWIAIGLTILVFPIGILMLLWLIIKSAVASGNKASR